MSNTKIQPGALACNGHISEGLVERRKERVNITWHPVNTWVCSVRHFHSLPKSLCGLSAYRGPIPWAVLSLGAVSSSLRHSWDKHILSLYSRRPALTTWYGTSPTQALQTQTTFTCYDFLHIMKPVKHFLWCLEQSTFSVNIRYCIIMRSGEYSICRLILSSVVGLISCSSQMSVCPTIYLWIV